MLTHYICFVGSRLSPSFFERQKETKRSLNCQSWAMPKPGAGNSILSLTWVSRTQVVEPFPAASQGACYKKLESGAEPGLKPRHYIMGSRCPKQH